MSLARFAPASRDELRELVLGHEVVGLHRDALKPFGLPTELWHEDGLGISVTAPDKKILELTLGDQVVVVGAGLRWIELQALLKEQGCALPIGPALPDMTVGDAIALNLPHGLDSQHGNWRDWVLGLTVMFPDGSIVSFGTRAVKSVAGYDVHKIFVGARGTLGIILEVILRLHPAQAVSKSEFVPTRSQGFFPTLPGGGWIQRVLPSDFPKAIAAAGGSLVAIDPASSTLWASLQPGAQLPRYREDWVLRTFNGDQNIDLPDPTLRMLMQRTKLELDPQSKFNPGEFGFL